MWAGVRSKAELGATRYAVEGSPARDAGSRKVAEHTIRLPGPLPVDPSLLTGFHNIGHVWAQPSLSNSAPGEMSGPSENPLYDVLDFAKDSHRGVDLHGCRIRIACKAPPVSVAHYPADNDAAVRGLQDIHVPIPQVRSAGISQDHVTGGNQTAQCNFVGAR